MKDMNKVNYRQRMSFLREDENHYRLFLDEQPATFTEQEGETPVNGYSYTGDEPDGSTLVEATDVDGENMHGKFVSGLIRKRYTQDEVEAIVLNSLTGDQIRQSELDTLQAYRTDCKDKVNELMTRQ